MSSIQNPLQSLLDQAAALPPSGALKPYEQRIHPTSKKISDQSILLLDFSGSMGQWCGADRKIEILKKAIAPIQSQYKILAFNSTTEWIGSSYPEPQGGTALHLAIAVAASIRPRQTLIVSDGQPDDQRQALAEAKKLSGTISTLYIGSDSDKEAIAFMAKLARLGCGDAYVQDLAKGHLALGQKIQNLLQAGKA